MTIGRKLTVAFGGFVGVTLILGYSDLTSVGRLGAELDTAVNKTAAKIRIATELAGDAARMKAAQRGIVAFSMLKASDQAEKSREEFRSASGDMQRLIEEVKPMLSTAGGRHGVATVETQLNLWMPLYDQIDRASTNQQFDAALVEALNRAGAVDGQLEAGSNELLDANKQLETAASQSAAEVTSGSRWMAWGLIAVCIAVGGVGLWTVRQVTSKIRLLSRELRDGAHQVASAAAQVSGGSQSLAQGASEQAASLEESSAAAEQINGMARTNAESSRKAAQIVAESQQRFAEANSSLAEMQSAMQGISTSSGKISNIIRVIEEIAFQTNILALNAAVEAARAGEAGMGFAVVADEVRNLAQRCAQAARDTTALIEESVVKSNDGKSRVDLVVGAIHGVTGQAVAIRELVEQVNAGSQQQSQGIGQMSQAIAEMGRVTQSAAASAEQSAAAAEELTAQSSSLLEAVGVLAALAG